MSVFVERCVLTTSVFQITLNFQDVSIELTSNRESAN